MSVRETLQALLVAIADSLCRVASLSAAETRERERGRESGRIILGQIMRKVWGEERVGAHVWLPQFLFPSLLFSLSVFLFSIFTTCLLALCVSVRCHFSCPERNSLSRMLAQSTRCESELTQYKTVVQHIQKLWTLTVNFLSLPWRQKPPSCSGRGFVFVTWVWNVIWSLLFFYCVGLGTWKQSKTCCVIWKCE